MEGIFTNSLKRDYFFRQELITTSKRADLIAANKRFDNLVYV